MLVHNREVFPEGKTLSGKRLVPQLMVGCVVFAVVGLLGTFFLAKLLSPLLHGSRTEFARQAQEREAKKR